MMNYIDLENKNSRTKPNQNNPLVSILINNYNYGKFLSKAIDSAINQTYANCEVIVVDDGSTDNSDDIIQKYQGSIIPIKKTNGGQASAFNIGFDKCHGSIICFLDSDDIFQPDKVEKVVNYLFKYPDAQWCFHAIELMDHHSKAINSEDFKNDSHLYDLRLDIKQGKLRNKTPFNRIVTSGMCFRYQFLSQLLPMPEEIKITSDDYLKYASLGLEKGIFLCEKLSIQILHNNNAYTFQENHDLISKVSILTAYWLKHKNPTLRRFSNKIFAFGLGTYLEDPRNPRIQEIIDIYISSLRWTESISFYSRTLYFRVNRIVELHFAK